MPFTFSHPAIVLPLLNTRKKLFSSTGLIIGSIIPDFESFIKVDEHKVYSHTWPGIFWFNLPLAILFAFIFHNIVRDPLIKNFPGAISGKLSGYIGFDWNTFFKKHLLMVICSMLIGITSHLLWDSFTHLSLADPDSIDSQIHLGPVRLYIILQYFDSALGLVIVAWYFLKHTHISVREVKNEIAATASRWRAGKKINQYWAFVAAIVCIMFVVSIIAVPGPLNAILLIDIVISGILLALILTPLIQKNLRPGPSG